MTIFLTWLHIIVAVSWIGGMGFLSIVLVPVLKREGLLGWQTALFRAIAQRFRSVVWIAMLLLTATGLILAGGRDIDVTEPGRWPAVFHLKMALVLLLFILTILHDLLMGPQVRRVRAIPEHARSSWERTLLRSSAWLPRVALLVALGVVAAAIVLTRS